MNIEQPGGMSSTRKSAPPPLYWVHARELRELQVLKDQSNLSHWYFIEQASISDVNINCTITLSSRVLSGGRGAESMGVDGNDDDDDAEQRGIFNKLMGMGYSQYTCLLSTIYAHTPFPTHTQVLRGFSSSM